MRNWSCRLAFQARDTGFGSTGIRYGERRRNQGECSSHLGRSRKNMALLSLMNPPGCRGGFEIGNAICCNFDIALSQPELDTTGTWATLFWVHGHSDEIAILGFENERK